MSKRTWRNKEILSLYRHGLSDDEISRSLNISIWSVRYWRRKNGYKPNPHLRRCSICGSMKWWRIGVSTKHGYSFYTFLTKWVVKTDGFCGPVDRWEVGVSYAPSEEEWARLEGEAIKMIDGKKRDRRWWVKIDLRALSFLHNLSRSSLQIFL